MAIQTWTPPLAAKPSFENSYNVMITPFPTGREKRKLIRASGQLRHTYSVAGLTAAQKAEITTFYDARDGSFEAFKWTPTGGAEGTYRFDSEPRFTEPHAGYWTCTVELIEVIA